jgi:hypothetical protein
MRALIRRLNRENVLWSAETIHGHLVLLGFDPPCPDTIRKFMVKPKGGRNKFQARKSLRLCLPGLRIRWIDPIAEAAELPDHSPPAPLFRLFGDGWAAFFVTGSLVQDQPDQPTLSMGNGPDRLIVSKARDGAAIHDFEDASFGPGCCVGSLIENASHVAVARRRPVTVIHARALFVARA